MPSSFGPFYTLSTRPTISLVRCPPRLQCLQRLNRQRRAFDRLEYWQQCTHLTEFDLILKLVLLTCDRNLEREGRGKIFRSVLCLHAPDLLALILGQIPHRSAGLALLRLEKCAREVLWEALRVTRYLVQQAVQDQRTHRGLRVALPVHVAMRP